VPFGLFGSRPTTPAVQEEEEEEIQVAAAPSLPFAGLFGAKRAPVQVSGCVEVTTDLKVSCAAGLLLECRWHGKHAAWLTAAGVRARGTAAGNRTSR
jgi:hypothetical protein